MNSNGLILSDSLEMVNIHKVAISNMRTINITGLEGLFSGLPRGYAKTIKAALRSLHKQKLTGEERMESFIFLGRAMSGVAFINMKERVEKNLEAIK